MHKIHTFRNIGSPKPLGHRLYSSPELSSSLQKFTSIMSTYIPGSSKCIEDVTLTSIASKYILSVYRVYTK